MEEQKRQERHSAMKNGAYSLTPALYSALSKGDAIVFSEHRGDKKHTGIILCGRGIEVIEEQAERIKDLEADIKIKQSVCETIEKELTEINKKLKRRIEEQETLLEQLIPIAERADTDDSEDTTIELAKQALKG